jgi:hypothetical protein
MASLLGSADRQLAQALRGVVHALGPTATAGTHLGVERALRSLGWDGTTPAADPPAR